MNRKKRLCQKRVGWTQERDCKKKKKKKEFGEKSRLNCNVGKKIGDFLGDSVVKNPPCNGEHGFNPSFGTKIPPVEEQLTPPLQGRAPEVQ